MSVVARQLLDSAVFSEHEEVPVVPSVDRIGGSMAGGTVSYGQWCLPVHVSELEMVAVAGPACS